MTETCGHPSSKTHARALTLSHTRRRRRTSLLVAQQVWPLPPCKAFCFTDRSGGRREEQMRERERETECMQSANPNLSRVYLVLPSIHIHAEAHVHLPRYMLVRPYPSSACHGAFLFPPIVSEGAQSLEMVMFTARIERRRREKERELGKKKGAVRAVGYTCKLP